MSQQMRLEMVPLPCTDVDAAKAFYVDQVGFVLDHDVEPGNGMPVTTDGTHVHVVRLAVADTDAGKALLGHVLDDVHVHDWVRPR